MKALAVKCIQQFPEDHPFCEEGEYTLSGRASFCEEGEFTLSGRASFL